MCRTNYMGEIIYSTDENTYEFYEKQSFSPKLRRCIDNTTTGSNKCVGYCKYDNHPGFLTAKHMKEHNCTNKACYYFIAKSSKRKIQDSEKLNYIFDNCINLIYE